MNVNYEIPDDLHRELKIRAAQEGVTLKDLIIRLLTEGVTREPLINPGRLPSKF